MSDTATPASSPAPSASTSSPAPSSTSAPSSGPKPASTSTPTATPSTSAAPVGETAAEKERRLRKIKVYGKEREVDLDEIAGDENKLLRYIQMGEAANHTMSEAAQVRKQWADFQTLLKKDPFEALKLFQVDGLAEAEKRLAQRYQEATMPEAERAILEERRNREKVENELKELRSKQENERRAALDKQVFEETERSFTEALSKRDLPKSPETLYMMAEVARINLDRGIDLTPDQLASEVERRMGTLFERSLKGYQDPVKLSKLLGPELVNKLLAHSVEQVKAKRATQLQAPPAQVQETTDTSKQERQKKDYNAVRRQLLKG